MEHLVSAYVVEISLPNPLFQSIGDFEVLISLYNQHSLCNLLSSF